MYQGIIFTKLSPASACWASKRGKISGMDKTGESIRECQEGELQKGDGRKYEGAECTREERREK